MQATVEVARRVSLVEKYRPRRIADFIGLTRIKRVLSNFVNDPYPAAFLFKGSPGVGKTAMAYAMAEEMSVEIHHLNSRQANWDGIKVLCEDCSNYAPLVLPSSQWGRSVPPGKRAFHLPIIDEADQMVPNAQNLLLSKLDNSQLVPNAIWIFTCNKTEGLEERFLSRCMELDFSEYGAKGAMERALIQHLDWIWHEEGGNGDSPNWAGVVRDKKTNVRDCLNYLQRELLERG